MGAAPRVGHFGDARLLLDDDLRVPSYAGALHRGQTQRLVKGVGVQRLRPAEHGRHGLDHGPDHVVVGVLRAKFPSGRVGSSNCGAFREGAAGYLLGERPAGGLAVSAQEERLGILRLEVLLDEGGPQSPGCP